MRRTLATLAASVVFLAGCGGSEEPTTAEETPAETSSPSATEASTGASTEEPDDEAGEEPTTAEASPTDGPDDGAIEVEIEGNEIEPRGKRVKVGVGEEIVLAVESDRAAELHVHSSPEQVLEITRGESTLTLTIDMPGIVDVEEHDTGVIILQLEVR